MVHALLMAVLISGAPGDPLTAGPHAVFGATEPTMGGNPGRMAGMRALMEWMRGSELRVTPTEQRPRFDADLRALGARVYGERCVICHGNEGDGRGPESARLIPRPRNLTAGVYRLRSTPTGSLPTDVDLFTTISRGMHGTAMLPWVSLPERERWALVAHVESLSPRFTEEPRGVPVTLPAPPRETRALVEKGRMAYQRAQCASCHGASGHGDGPSAPTLRDEDGEPIRPPDFARGRFLRGTRMEDIYLTLRTGLDGTPMPSYAESLSGADTWALAAYVRSLVREPPVDGGMMCMMMGGDADAQERLGMMIDMPGMPSDVDRRRAPRTAFRRTRRLRESRALRRADE